MFTGGFDQTHLVHLLAAVAWCDSRSSVPLSDGGGHHQGEEPHRVPLPHLLSSQDMTDEKWRPSCCGSACQQTVFLVIGSSFSVMLKCMFLN